MPESLDLIPATLLKKSLWLRCFPVNFTKFLGAPFLQNTSKRVLLSEITFTRVQIFACQSFLGNQFSQIWIKLVFNILLVISE